MKSICRSVTLRLAACLAVFCLVFGCGDHSTISGAADDDSTDDDSAADDDSEIDDDTSVDDDSGDDSGADDDTVADDYLAPAPQLNIEPRDYAETAPDGPMRLKAGAYDDWHLAWHQPFYGSTVEVLFTDDAHTEAAGYGGMADSCIWSGTYLASQAFRYYVTGDTQARANVLSMVATLDSHLHVTGKPGYIARYLAPQDSIAYQGDVACAQSDSCHKVDEGPYAGAFWEGQSSRDQYTGWFFGMTTAYDLLEDEPTRQLIAADVAEVVHNLILQNWMILELNGRPTNAGPQILAIHQITWLLAAYHMTGSEEFSTPLKHWLLDKQRTMIKLANINFLGRFVGYYGNNLAHTNDYTMLRLGKVYFSAADYQWLKDFVSDNDYGLVPLSHNAYFDGIYMSQMSYQGSPGDPHQTQLLQDLSEFRPAPNVEYFLPDRDPSTYQLDGTSVLLHNLMVQFPFLAQIMEMVEPQAEEAFPVQQQCTADFLWQRNPYVITACGTDNPAYVHPGVDYLAAYWLASYHKFITRDL